MSYSRFLSFLFSLCFFSANIFSVPPVITNVNPPTGPSQSFDIVTITGFGFTGATAVNFGTQPAASFVVVSDTTITAASLPHVPQVVTIFVTTPSGTSMPSDTSFFTFQGDWEAFVSNNFDGTVSVIDVQKDTVIDTVTVGTSPLAIDILPDGSRAYVANTFNGTLAAIDPATNTVENTIPVFGATSFSILALDLLPNGAKNYVVLDVANSVAIVDNATETSTSAITVGTNPVNIAITPDGTQAYALNEFDDTVSVIDTTTDTVTTTIPVGTFPVAASATPDSTQVYVANFFSSNVSVIDTSTNTVTATIPVGNFPAAVAITPDGTKAYIAASDVFVIDTSTNTVIADIPVGSVPSAISITPDGKQAYVMNQNSNNVSVIDTATDTVTATIPVGGFPQAQVISPDGKQVFVVNFNDNTVSVIDTTTNTVIATLAVGEEPAAIAITPDQAPLAQFTFIVGAVGTPTIFDASSSVSPTGTIANYSWDFGDGSPIVNTPNPIIAHVYNSPGTFVVTLIVTNTAGTSLTQVFYFSSATNFGNTSSPVTNNNGGPTAERIHILTIGLAPPSNFIGCVKKNEFLNKTELILLATFTASPSPGVVFYQIFQNGRLIQLIPANDPLRFSICLKSRNAANEFTVVAVGPGGILSPPVPITIVGSCCSFHDLK